MTIVNCPRCREQVLAPTNEDPGTLVRCPLCRDAFELAEVLSCLPPALLIVEDEEEILAPAGFGEVHEAADLDEELPLLGDVVESRAAIDQSAEDFQFETSPPPAFRPKRTPKIKVERVPRRRRSAVREIVKVVAGGIVGLAIGQTILWWGLKRDPLEMGPHLSQLAPWAVPAAFHGEDDGSELAGGATPDEGSPTFAEQLLADLRDPEETNETVIDEGPTGTLDSNSADEVATPVRGSTGGDLTTMSGPTMSGPEVAVESLENSLAEAGNPETNELAGDPGEQHTVNKEAMPDPIEAPSDPPQPAEPELRLLGIRRGPTFNAAELLERVDLAGLANAAWDVGYGGGGATNDRTLARSLYQDFASLGEYLGAVEWVDGPPSAVRREARILLQQLLKSELKLRVVRMGGPQWMDRQGSRGGVLLAGTVRSVEPAGKFHQAEVQLSPSRSVSVLVPSESTDCEAGQELLLVGMMLTNPAENLDGYVGNSPKVVISGCHVATE